MILQSPIITSVAREMAEALILAAMFVLNPVIVAVARSGGSRLTADSMGSANWSQSWVYVSDNEQHSRDVLRQSEIEHDNSYLAEVVVVAFGSYAQ